MKLKNENIKIAIVTGGSKGLGLATVRGLSQKGIHTILTARDRKAGELACKKLRKENLPVEFFLLDITKGKHISALAKYVKKKSGKVDILVNNAGILANAKASDFSLPLDQQLKKISSLKAPLKGLRDSLEAHVIGPMHLIQSLVPLMKNGGRIVNVSSLMGQLSSMGAGAPAYRISKAALNALTCVFSKELASRKILINSASPGWVKTDMGGKNAPLSVEQGVETILWLATLPDNGPSGGFFEKKLPISW